MLTTLSQLWFKYICGLSLPSGGEGLPILFFIFVTFYEFPPPYEMKSLRRTE